MHLYINDSFFIIIIIIIFIYLFIFCAFIYP